MKDHPLTGNYKGLRELHIEPDWLLIYSESKEAAIECGKTVFYGSLFAFSFLYGYGVSYKVPPSLFASPLDHTFVSPKGFNILIVISCFHIRTPHYKTTFYN